MEKLRQDMNMGANFRLLRIKCGLTQEQVIAQMQVLDKDCDITRSTYSRYETGELNIKISHCILLRKVFRCSYDDFFEGLGYKEKE